ncbi:MAG: hypothetical protein RMJ15_06630 [Nitrososphaerota archaeon]|nr:hypothetical protein [Candidatus Bathyarchaeota archaeon]MDW8023394.1 hypothetical protein [Nitrososphaerota archaeon]
MPWEITQNYIRSGHRKPEEFEAESLRTVVLSEAKGISAIIGKPKGKDAAEILSFLFDVSKGWTLERAKECLCGQNGSCILYIDCVVALIRLASGVGNLRMD